MISAVIFDMDGVIIDSEPVFFQIEQEIFRDLGLELTREEHAKYVGRSDLWKIIKNTYKLDFNIEEIHQTERTRYLEYLTSSFNDGPIDGVADLIESLHSEGKTLVLASSSSMENINLVLNKFDLSEYFISRVSGAELQTSKPHPEIFLKAAALAESPSQNCLVIEDSANGVRAAKAANMKCVGYRNPNSGNQDLSAADCVISSFGEFDFEKI